MDPAPRAGFRAAVRSWLAARPLLVLTAVAFGVRVAFLLLEPSVELTGDEPSWKVLGVDALARRRFSLMKHHIIFYPPGYPLFIAFAYTFLGGLEGVKWLQALAGALLVPAVGRLGAHVFSPRAGLVAGAIAAFYPDLVWYSVHFWSETLFMLLLWWAFERIIRSDATGRTGSAIAGGVLWGAACLTRETAFYFTPLAGLWLGFGARRPVRRGAAFVLAAALTVAPWTLRNWIVFHGFVPIATVGSLNLWQGNTRIPREEVYRLGDSVAGPIAQNRLAWRMALQAIRERQPGWIFEKAWSELPMFWGAESLAFAYLRDGSYGAPGGVTLALGKLVTTLPYLAVLALAVAGVFLPPRGRARLLLLGFLAFYVLLHVVSVGADRYRLPVMPVLFFLAGDAWVAWRAGSFPALSPRRRLALLGAALAMTAVVLPSLLKAS